MDDSYKNHPLCNPKIAVRQQLDKSNFKPDLALNLTLEKKPWEDQTNLYDKGLTEKQFTALESNFKRFLNKLNQSCYGRNWKRLKMKNPDKTIQIFAVIEVKRDNYHFHGAVKTPDHLTNEEFIKLILRWWSKTTYGSKHENMIKKIYYKKGWYSYITKDIHKHASQGYVSYSNFS